MKESINIVRKGQGVNATLKVSLRNHANFDMTNVTNWADATNLKFSTIPTRVGSMPKPFGTVPTRVGSPADPSGTVPTRVGSPADPSGTVPTRVGRLPEPFLLTFTF